MTEARKDEIDLMALLLQAVRAVRNNFWLLLLFFVLGTALGFGYYYSSKKIYQNKMIVSSKIMTESYVGQLAFVRVYSGTLKANSRPFNAGRNFKEFASKLYHIHADPNSHSYVHAYTHCYGYCHSYADSNTHAYSNANSNCHGYIHTYADADSDVRPIHHRSDRREHRARHDRHRQSRG